MLRHVLVPIVVVAGCAHESDRAQTTTLTSGTEAVQVTSATIGDPADRLAAEICRHEATCGRIESGSSDVADVGEQLCVGNTTPRMRATIDGWDCPGMVHRAGFERCLAAIRSERCATRLDAPDVLPACRKGAACQE
jgi:hypothetical protein